MSELKKRIEQAEALLKSSPFVAILRGIRPEEVEAHGKALYESGIRLIEVPMNSPSPLESIGILRRSLPMDALVGAGTVTRVEECRKLSELGAELVVSPHTDPALIEATVGLSMLSFPGVFSPTDAFTAVRHGARFLKLFPAKTAGPGMLKSMKTTLPPEIKILAVGGISVDTLKDWVGTPVAGFGVGGSLYKPGFSVEQSRGAAEALVGKWNELIKGKK